MFEIKKSRYKNIKNMFLLLDNISRVTLIFHIHYISVSCIYLRAILKIIN